MRRVAGAQRRDVVVGCGGDRGVFFRGAPDMPPEEVAIRVGLQGLDAMTVTSSEIAARLRRLSVLLSVDEDHYKLRRFVAQHVEELAVAAGAITPRVFVVASPPASMLIAAGRAEDLAQVEALVKAWAEPDTKPPPSASKVNDR